MQKTEGYITKQYNLPVKRYCQTLDLKEDPELIEEYRKRHSFQESWTIVRNGIKEVGILEMEIYILDNHLFMIVETPLDFEWDTAMKKLSILPMQKEWEELMSVFQKVPSGSTSAEKWKLMERIFYLYE